MVTSIGTVVYWWIRVFYICATLRSVAGYVGLDQPHCIFGYVNNSKTVPRGGFEVDNVHLLEDELTENFAESCVSKCCQMGPENCQYLWIVLKYCYAVSCDSGSVDCEPIELPDSSSLDSIYFPVTLDTGNLDSTGGGGIGVGNSDGMGTEGVITDLAPVANAGPDVTILYPKNSVTLNASLSTDDQGITYYLWQLTAEDHLDQATLINPSLPVLRVLNLTPGSYTFTLTVADSALQTSTDTVQVNVVPEKTTFPGTTITTAAVTTTAATTTTTEIGGIVYTSTFISKDLTESKTDVLANVSAKLQDEIDSHEEDLLYTKKANLLKVVVPVLLSVAAIFVLSAAIVGVAFCFVHRNKRRMKHLYQYKRLPGTLEKT